MTKTNGCELSADISQDFCERYLTSYGFLQMTQDFIHNLGLSENETTDVLEKIGVKDDSSEFEDLDAQSDYPAIEEQPDYNPALNMQPDFNEPNFHINDYGMDKQSNYNSTDENPKINDSQHNSDSEVTKKKRTSSRRKKLSNLKAQITKRKHESLLKDVLKELKEFKKLSKKSEKKKELKESEDFNKLEKMLKSRKISSFLKKLSKTIKSQKRKTKKNSKTPSKVTFRNTLREIPV
jgi:hypothetical protein